MFSIQGFLTCQSKLPMTYKYLSQAERYQIYTLMKAGQDQSQIAKVLDRKKSTISRELSRNTGSRGYRPKQACEMSGDRAQNSRNANAVAPWVKDEVNALLRVQWSPEQIASQLPISHETVYQHVYADKAQGRTLWKNLRCQKQKRKRYAGSRDRLGQIPNRRPLSEWPLHIEAPVKQRFAQYLKPTYFDATVNPSLKLVGRYTNIRKLLTLWRLKLERRIALKNVGILGVLASGTAPAVHAQAAIRWRLASSFPKSLDTIYGAAETFVKKVGELSGGKFVISSHAAGELMPAFGVVDGVQNGTVEVAHTAPYYFFGKDETFALGCTIPFGLNSRQMTAWMFQGNGLKLMREFYKQYNIINFPAGNSGAQMGGWYRKEVKSLADIKGLKFRVGGFAGKVVERLGGVPQNIPGGEIYQALEKGTIDAAEWIGPYDDQKLGFNKVAPFYYYPGWWEGCSELDVFINNKAYNSLSAENKAIIECAAAYAHIECQAKYDARNPGALMQLVASKTKVLPFPKDVMDAAFKEAMALYEELSAKNPNWKKVYADYSAFRKQQNLWFRFSEATFDRYMQSVKL